MRPRRFSLQADPLPAEADERSVVLRLCDACVAGDRPEIEGAAEWLLTTPGGRLVGTDYRRLLMIHAAAVASVDVGSVSDLPHYWRQGSRALGWTEKVVERSRGVGALARSVAEARQFLAKAECDAENIAAGRALIGEQIAFLSSVRDLPTAEALTWAFVTHDGRPLYGAKLGARIRHDVSPAVAIPINERTLQVTRPAALLNTHAASLRQAGRVDEALRHAAEAMLKEPNDYAANTTGKIAKVRSDHRLVAFCNQLHRRHQAGFPDCDRRAAAIKALTARGLRDVAEIGLALQPQTQDTVRLRRHVDQAVLERADQRGDR